MKTYKAKRKGSIRYVLTGVTLLPFIIFIIAGRSFIDSPLMILLSFLPLLLVLWIFLDTTYTIKNSQLMYRSGFLRGSISVSDIREIHVSNNMMISGAKPALAKGGLVIRYNSFDEVYIAPQNNEEVINALLMINPDIQISQH